jgi:DTW domain-containing protein YfiP
MTAPRRTVCPRCRRPPPVCYCAELPSLPPLRTRVLILQHPRERRIGIGTGRMAHLALPGSVLRVGIDFSEDEVVRQLLDGPAPAWLMFPAPGAVPLEQLPRQGPLVLTVLDGSWALARKLFTRNPFLSRLPRVAFVPRQPSQYRIRAQPAQHCVATIEALAHALAVLEDGLDESAVLRPFLAMVERQIAFRAQMHPSRHAAFRARARRRPTLPERLASLTGRLVCAQGEGNAWPTRYADRPPAELVQWSAVRLATGERMALTVATRAPIAPSTPRFLDVPTEVLAAGMSPDEARARWRAFVRPDDLLVVWGVYHLGLARALELGPPAEVIDLRPALAQHLRRRGGTVEEALTAMSLPAPAPVPGRCARRLDALASLVTALAGAGAPR